MAKKIFIGGRIESAEVGGVVTGANAILDDTKQKKQNVINKETDDELARLENAKQDNLTLDNVPTENSTNPVTSGGVYTADKALSDAIEAILLLIPSAATALNKLVDTNTMNSSISTATATFRGTYNAVSDLGLTYQATHAQIEAALDALGLTADNNDFAFVQIPVSDQSQDIAKTERFKFNGTNWLYEYDLNTSGFTVAQWAAINSTITLALVQKLAALPTNAELLQALGLKQDVLTFDNAPTSGSSNPVKSGGVYTAISDEATARGDEDTRLAGLISDEKTRAENAEGALGGRLTTVEGSVGNIEVVIPSAAAANNKLVDNNSLVAYVAAIVTNMDATFNVQSTDGHVTLQVTQVDGVITSVQVTTSDIASAADLTLLAGRMTSAEGNITSLTTRMGTAETDIATLRAMYNALQQSAPQVIEPTDTWPVANPSTTVIYRVIDRVNTPPQYYQDYMWNGTAFVLMATYNNAVDTTPQKNSANLVTSGGIFANIGAFDISEYNKSGSTLATYADLTAALAALPSDFQKGGMSIKFVQSSDNKYVQAQCIGDTFTTDINQWQITDEEPTPGTPNLVKSNGVAKYIENIIGAKYKLFNGVLTGSGIWNGLATEKHLVIPVKSGDIISAKGSGVQLSFLKSYTIPVLYAHADYSTAEGFTTRIETNDGTYTCPSDAVFLIVNYSNNGTIRPINRLEVNGEDFLNGIVYTAQKTADEAISELSSLYFNLNNGRLGPNSNWMDVTSGEYMHVAINIKEGDIIKIKAYTNENVGFLKDYTPPTNNNQAVNYSSATGYNQRIQTSDGTYTCPSDAKFLVVGYGSNLKEININGNDYLPIILRDIQDSIEVNTANIKNINDKQETEYNFVHGIENAVKHNGILGPNKIWFSLANGRSVVYKVKEGDEVVINTVGRYGFLKSYTQPTADYQLVDYSSIEGYDDRLAGAGTYIVPSDVNYLVVCVANAEGVVQLPSVLTVNGLDMIKPVSKDDYIFPSVRVVQISDPHCDLGRDNQTENGVTNVQRMALMTGMIDDVRKTGQIDLVVCTGDMAMGDRDTLRRNPNGFKEYVIDNLKEPFAPVPGNHDNYTDEEWYNAYGKPRQYSVDIGKWYLIVCDAYGGNSVPNRNKFYGIDTTFLETELSTAKKLGKMPIFCVHTITPGDADIVIDGMTEEEAAERIASARQSISDAKSLLYQYGCLLYLLGHSHITSNGLGYVQNHWECNPGWFGPINDYTYGTSPWGINLFEKIGNKMTVSSIVLAHDYVDTPRLGNVPASKTTVDLWDDNAGKATYKY